jgi:hypothetical protein
MLNQGNEARKLRPNACDVPGRSRPLSPHHAFQDWLSLTVLRTAPRGFHVVAGRVAILQSTAAQFRPLFLGCYESPT